MKKKSIFAIVGIIFIAVIAYFGYQLHQVRKRPKQSQNLVQMKRFYVLPQQV